MKSLIRCGFAIVLGFMSVLGASAQPTVPVGAGGYYLAPKADDKPPPRAQHRTAAMAAQAAPTNQWYSALIFGPKPEALFAHPLTVLAAATGFEMALAGKVIVPTERRDVEVHYPHRDPIVFSPVAFEPEPAKLAQDFGLGHRHLHGARGRRDAGHGVPRQPLCLFPAFTAATCASACRRRRSVWTPRPTRVCWRWMSRARPMPSSAPRVCAGRQVSPTEWIARLPAG